VPLLNPGDPFPRLTITTSDDQMLTIPDAFAGDFGVVLDAEDGVLTIAFELGPDGKLAAIYMVRNPDKLPGLGALLRSCDPAIGVGDLLHHALAGEQASERGAAVAPVAPGLERPAVRPRPRRGHRVVVKRRQQERASRRR